MSDIYFCGSYSKDKILNQFLWIDEFQNLLNIFDSFKQKMVIKS